MIVKSLFLNKHFSTCGLELSNVTIYPNSLIVLLFILLVNIQTAEEHPLKKNSKKGVKGTVVKETLCLEESTLRKQKKKIVKRILVRITPCLERNGLTLLKETRKEQVKNAQT